MDLLVNKQTNCPVYVPSLVGLQRVSAVHGISLTLSIDISLPSIRLLSAIMLFSGDLEHLLN